MQYAYTWFNRNKSIQYLKHMSKAIYKNVTMTNKTKCDCVTLAGSVLCNPLFDKDKETL